MLPARRPTPPPPAPAFSDSAVQRLLNQQQQLHEGPRPSDRMLRRARFAALLAKRRSGFGAFISSFLSFWPMSNVDRCGAICASDGETGSPPLRDDDDDVAYKERHVILPLSFFLSFWLWAMNTKVTETKEGGDLGALRRHTYLLRRTRVNLGCGTLATRMRLHLNLSAGNSPTSPDRKGGIAGFLPFPADDTVRRLQPPTPSFAPLGTRDRTDWPLHCTMDEGKRIGTAEQDRPSRSRLRPRSFYIHRSLFCP